MVAGLQAATEGLRLPEDRLLAFVEGAQARADTLHACTRPRVCFGRVWGTRVDGGGRGSLAVTCAPAQALVGMWAGPFLGQAGPVTLGMWALS